MNASDYRFSVSLSLSPLFYVKQALDPLSDFFRIECASQPASRSARHWSLSLGEIKVLYEAARISDLIIVQSGTTF